MFVTLFCHRRPPRPTLAVLGGSLTLVTILALYVLLLSHRPPLAFDLTARQPAAEDEEQRGLHAAARTNLKTGRRATVGNADDRRSVEGQDPQRYRATGRDASETPRPSSSSSSSSSLSSVGTNPDLEGVLVSRNSSGRWVSLNCGGGGRKLRRVVLPMGSGSGSSSGSASVSGSGSGSGTGSSSDSSSGSSSSSSSSAGSVGRNFSLYVYDSQSEDSTATARALKGWYFERREISQFLRAVPPEMPLIDVGANVGLVTLQAALQGRQVVAVEPVPQNAVRLCRSVLDFAGRASLVRVVQNAVSSDEKSVTMVMPQPKARTQYAVSRGFGSGGGGGGRGGGGRGGGGEVSMRGGFGAVEVDAIWMDRLLDVLPFRKAALKIDVEGHEGHVLAGAERLFQEVDIPMVWMEWEHVKTKSQADYGGAFIIQFMQKRGFRPFHLMTGHQLSTDHFLKWPFTVLWRRADFDK